MKRLAIFFLLTGCGYQFQGSGSILPQNVKTVHVMQAENQTTEPGLTLQFTEALRSRFERYGVVRLVDSPGEADAVLRTVIKDVSTRVRNTSGPTDSGPTDQELDQDLALTISAELKKRSGQTLWRNDRLKIYQSFAGVSGVVVTQSAQFAGSNLSAQQIRGLNNRELARGQKEIALNEALEESARRIYSEAVAEDF
jgi:outer membrane lipopolysaccharide assembly protein LptE/RlpB